MTTKNEIETSEDATAQRHQRSRKTAYSISIAGMVIALVLTIMGHNPLAGEAPIWLKAVTYAVIFMPILSVSLGRSFQQGESADARAAAYKGPQRIAFSITAPSILKSKSTAVFMIPAMVLVSVVMLFVMLGQFLIERMMAAGVTFEVFNAVFIGFTVFVAGLLAWTIAVFMSKSRVEKAFRSEVEAELKLHGFSWGKKDFPVVSVDYTQTSPAVLDDSEHRSSHWTIKWDGEKALVAPVEPVI